MEIYDFYGNLQDEAAAASVFVRDGWAGPDNAELEAVIIAAQEYIINLSPLVLDEQGNALNWPSIKVAHSNPAIRPVSDGGAGVHLDGAIAQLFPAHIAANRGIQLGGGSKILEGGPVDKVWVTGMVSGKRIRSERVKVGLYSSDVVLSPVYLLRSRGGATPTPTDPTPPDGDAREDLRGAISDLNDVVLRLRSAENRLG